MDVLLYLCLGVVLYVVGSLIIMAVNVNKVVSYFIEHPDGLPKDLPPHVKEFKDHIGEDKFDELYKDFQEGRK